MSYNVTIPVDIREHIVSLINKGVKLSDIYEKRDILLNGKPISYNQITKISKSIKNKLPWNSKLKDPTYYKAIESVEKFDLLRDRMYFMAHKYCFKGEEVDELVNEIWLFGNVQRCKDYAVTACIMNDIKRYRANKNKTRSERAYKCNTTVSLDKIREDIEDVPIWEAVIDKNIERADQEDLFNSYTRGLSKEDSLIVKLKFLAGLDHNDICKAVGCTRTHVFNRVDVFKKSMELRLSA